MSLGKNAQPRWWYNPLLYRPLALFLTVSAVSVAVTIVLVLVRWRWLGWGEASPTLAVWAVQPLALLGLVAHGLIPVEQRWQEWRKAITAGESTVVVCCWVMLMVPEGVSGATAFTLAMSAATATFPAVAAAVAYGRQHLRALAETA